MQYHGVCIHSRIHSVWLLCIARLSASGDCAHAIGQRPTALDFLEDLALVLIADLHLSHPTPPHLCEIVSALPPTEILDVLWRGGTCSLGAVLHLFELCIQLHDHVHQHGDLACVCVCVCVCFEKWGLDTKGERGLTCWDGRLRRQNGRRGQALDDLSCSHRSLWRRLPRDRRRRQLFGLRWERRGGHLLLERWPHEVPPFLPCAFHPFGACNANTLHCCSLYLDLFGRRSHRLLHFLGKGRQQLLPDTCHHQAITRWCWPEDYQWMYHLR